MSITQIDIDALPPPKVVEELDFEALLSAAVAELIARFPPIAGVIQLESEPARKLLEVDAFREVLIRARINAAARSQLLAFASESDLDHLAAFYDVARLPGEDDARLRARVVLAISGRSTGGTAERYRYIAMTASVDVRDVIVWRDAITPTVNVAVYSFAPGGVAGPSLLSTVEAALNAPDVRMVSDTISVRSAVTQTRSVVADVWLLPDAPLAVFDGLEAALRADFAAEAGLGFDLTRAWITARLMRPGVQRVEILSPSADVAVAEFEALALGAITLTFRGRAL
jgi:phage-related baseplate assembly protein